MPIALPVVIVRAEAKATSDRCRIFIKHYPTVYGKRSKAEAKCKRETQTGHVNLIESNASIPYRFPRKFANTSSSSNLFKEDCLSFFMGEDVVATLAPPAELRISSSRNKTLQSGAQASHSTQKTITSDKPNMKARKKLKTKKAKQQEFSWHLIYFCNARRIAYTPIVLVIYYSFGEVDTFKYFQKFPDDELETLRVSYSGGD